jgi:two-component system response regulator
MGSTPYVLMVEDNPDDEMLTLDALRSSGVSADIQVARDGAEALEALNAERLPRLVLLDLKLPKVPGMEVLRRMRAQDETRHIPVVVLTSSTEDQDVQAAYRTGANSYLRKPIGFEEFNRAVQTLGVYWLELNRAPV